MHGSDFFSRLEQYVVWAARYIRAGNYPLCNLGGRQD